MHHLRQFALQAVFKILVASSNGYILTIDFFDA